MVIEPAALVKRVEQLEKAQSALQQEAADLKAKIAEVERGNAQTQGELAALTKKLKAGEFPACFA
jgi:uncharacterized coiled-coil protein SlyX